MTITTEIASAVAHTVGTRVIVAVDGKLWAFDFTEVRTSHANHATRQTMCEPAFRRTKEDVGEVARSLEAANWRRLVGLQQHAGRSGPPQRICIRCCCPQRRARPGHGQQSGTHGTAPVWA